MKFSRLALNIYVLAHTLVAYGLGIGLLIMQGWGFNWVGVGVLIHALILSTVLTHEFIRGTIFKERTLNAFWGQVMTHLNGACYATWDELVEHHFNHYVHHADFVAFDIPKHIQTLPAIARQLVVFTEWAYFPTLEFELRFRLMFSAFWNPEKKSQRLRTVALLIYRGTFFALLAWFAPQAIALYALAYVCFVNIIRFTDAFHHTYEYVTPGQPIPKRDRGYEQERTFSNLVSVEYPVLNLLFLNFSDHNAHHHDMRCPWYELPQLHESLYGKEAKNLLPLPALIGNYHQFRLERLLGRKVPQRS